MNLEYAQKWADLLGNDTDAYADLYAEDGEFSIECTMMDDHMHDTLSTREMIAGRLGGLANQDAANGVGVYAFTATEFIGDERYGLIHWDVSVEGASTYRGIASEGKTLSTKGSTFLQFREDGKIVLESTCWNDNPIFAELGIPIMTPHYWDENFDPAALMA